MQFNGKIKVWVFLLCFKLSFALRQYTKSDIARLRSEVTSIFYHAYDGYLKYANGYDELRPLSCSGVNTWSSSSLTLIDALDTLAVMGNFSEFRRVVDHLTTKVNFDKDINVSVFETNIRIVGGLLSAHLLSHKAGIELDPGYPCNGPLLSLAEKVARKLLPAFDTKTGMPYGTVNLKYGVPEGETSVTCTAGIGTFIVEFGALSRLIGDPIYEEVALNALYSLYNHRSTIGLLGNHIDVQTGTWTAQDAGIGAGVDSYYEYLVKGAIMLNRPELLHMFDEGRAAIDKYLKRDDWHIWASMSKGQITLPVFQSLQAFWPGLLSLLGDINSAMKSLHNMHTVWKQYGFLPEFYNIPNAEAGVNRDSYPLRPELIESVMYLYRATGDPYLLEVGEDILKSIQYSAKTKCGYATIKNVKDHRKQDTMESFFLAETTKYLYLLFDPDNFLNSDGGYGTVLETHNGECIIESSYIFNTEAHPIDDISESLKIPQKRSEQEIVKGDLDSSSEPPPQGSAIGTESLDVVKLASSTVVDSDEINSHKKVSEEEEQEMNSDDDKENLTNRKPVSKIDGETAVKSADTNNSILTDFVQAILKTTAKKPKNFDPQMLMKKIKENQFPRNSSWEKRYDLMTSRKKQTSMELAKLQASKLFTSSPIDQRDKFEEKYDRAFQNLQGSIYGPNAKELNTVITSMVSLDTKQQEEYQIGFIYLMLTDTQLAAATLRDLLIVTRDGLEFVISHLIEVINVKFQKLAEIAKHQLLWLFKELLKSLGSNLKINGLLWALLRQAQGGDVSPKNIAWIEGILDILIEQRSRFEKFAGSVGLVAYAYVRLIEDHNAPHLIPLRNKEVKFIMSLIRERFQEIIPLGRDFVRLLQNVARIPEFQQLWKDILTNPKSLSPTFTGIFQMLSLRTSRQFIGNRITPDIENKLHFFTSSVKFGNHKRYQDWFQDRYFSTPESQSLRSDVIRYIINAIHPTNELLCSDITPRWAIIGWLLTSCTNPVALTNAKLAIFYDWLCFDPLRDNIMNVEPGILVMYHSIKNVPLVSSTLLDFLCRIMKNFYPKGEERIRSGVYNSLRVILEKQVIPNLGPLFESPKLERDLRSAIRENFREFMPTTPPFTASTIENQNHIDEGRFGKSNTIDLKEETDPQFSDDEIDEKKVKVENSSDEDDEDDDDLPLSKVRLKEKPAPDKVDLPNSIRESFDKFITSKTLNDFDSFLSDFRVGSGVQLDTEQESYVFDNVLNICKSTLPEKCDLEEFKNLQKLEQSINFPLYGFFKVLYQQEEKGKKCAVMSKLLEYCYSRSPNMGFLLLYYLKVHSKLASKKNEKAPVVFRSNVYKLFYQWINQKSKETNQKIDACLERDLGLMEQYSLNMFLWLIPDIYREFDNHVVNNSEVLRIVVRCIDARNLADLIYDVTQGKLCMFKNEGVIDVIRESLEYETLEQMCLWQLLTAHDVPLSYIQDILPELEATNHEALTSILSMLKKEEPSEELVKLLLSREMSKSDRGDPFVTSTFRHWCVEFEEQLSEIIANLLISKYPQSSPTKRKRTLKSNNQSNGAPSAEQLLSHLEHLRRSCRYGHSAGTALYLHEKMQRALQQAFTHSTEGQKKQFNELFSLAVEDETTVSRRGTSSRGGRKPPTKKETNSNSTPNKKANEANNKYSSEESSDEDRSKNTKQPAKRRKKAVLSDSD
ncbi:CLUMA_CG009044, isoform A [Clunio marinus]|uniref:alpha-1,2-Mannosidase n=1 Tax=Clunio marinus TaxID=568069 RepID=A0A1J1I5G9_9DIPT|nr:CLUMA_CG009044, isoform A [Clunio marinus]